MPSSSVLSFVALAMLGVAGCVDADLQSEDAAPRPPEAVMGTPDATVSTASGPVDATLPDSEAVPSGVAGEYAVRTRYFQQDAVSVTMLRQQSIQHAHIEPGADGSLSIRLQLCSQRLNASGPFSNIAAQAAFAQLWPERTGQFVLDDNDDFHVELLPLAVGYDSTPPPGCVPGGTLPVSPERPWLSSPCVCPRSDDVPTSASDCRVSDPDQDDAAGVTIHVTGDFERFEYVRTLDSSQIVEGKLAADGRHRARYFKKELYGKLDCLGEGCSPANPPVCALDTTSVEFARLPTSKEPWTCTSVLEGVSVGRLLPLDALTFPAQCNK